MPTITQNTPAPTEVILSSLRSTTGEEVDKTIKLLKISTSTGINDISSPILKTWANHELIIHLVKTENMSMAAGTFPSQLKIYKVYPKHKPTTFKTPPTTYLFHCFHPHQIL